MSKQMHKIINEILTPDDLIIDGGRFAGNIEVNSLINNTGPLKSYNLMQSNGSIADVFKSLSVPMGLLHFGNMFDKHMTFDSESDSDSSSSSSDSSSSDSSSDSSSSDSSSDSDNNDSNKKTKTKKTQKGGKNPKKYRKPVARMVHHPDTSVVPDDLFDKFIELAQDLRTNKKQRSTKKSQEHLSKRKTKKQRD
jgi:hypothetical protein